MKECFIAFRRVLASSREEASDPKKRTSKMIVNIDGEFVQEGTLAVSDGAVLFGDTLFETLLARGGEIRLLSDHLDRIEFSAALLDFPFDRERAADALRAVAQRLRTPASRLRLTLTRGEYEGLYFPLPERSRLIATAVPYTEPTDQERRDGVRCAIAPNRRVNPLSHLPQMKRGNYVDCLYAAAHARSLGFREALFVDEQGRLLEGATTNVFLIQNGTLITPPCGDIVLPGIMRRQVLRAVARLKVPVFEKQILLPKLYGADEVFLTSSLVGVLPVAAVGDQPLYRGDLGLMLLEEIERFCNAQRQTP
jgi:branched-chain amino acid aminotransferase